MNSAHIHLLFNHFPIIGSIFSSLVLAFGVIRKNEVIIKTGLSLFVLTALLALPAFFSGEGAEDILESIGQKNESLIEKHEELAEKAFWFCEIAGAISAFAIFSLWRKKKFAFSLASIALLAGFINIYLFTVTGNTGGEIRHSEIRQINATDSVSGKVGDDD
jgi:uncharacterized membrane protein